MSWYLKWGEGRGRSVVRLQEWLGWSAHCLAVHASCGVHVQYPAFISVSKWQLGFWSFCILFIICPNWAYTQLFLVPCSLFVFCCLRRCLSRYKHGSPSSQMAQWQRTRLTLQELQETGVQFLGWKDPLEEEMAAPASILAGIIPWTEKPGGL